MRGRGFKLLVAILLVTAAAAFAAELSGRWDRTLVDANDEAGFVAIVLCVGAALGLPTALLNRIRAPRSRAWLVALAPAPAMPLDRRAVEALDRAGPPVLLRI